MLALFAAMLLASFDEHGLASLGALASAAAAGIALHTVSSDKKMRRIEEAKSQAVCISAWFEKSSVNSPARFTIVLNNSSSDPVYDLVFGPFTTNDKPEERFLETFTLNPGQRKIVPPTNIVSSPDRIIFAFKDHKGQDWERDEQSDLKTIAGDVNKYRRSKYGIPQWIAEDFS